MLALFLSNATLYINDLTKNCFKVDLVSPFKDMNLKLIVSGIFVPQHNQNNEIFADGGLCLVDENQQIFSVGLEESADLENGFADDATETSLTPYARMLLDEKNKIKLQERFDQIELNEYLGQHRSRRKIVEQMFTSVPSHILPAIETISTSFLTMLLEPDKKEEDEKRDDKNSTDDEENNLSLSDQDEDEKKDIQMKKIELVNAMEVDVHSKSNELILNENFNWLLPLL